MVERGGLENRCAFTGTEGSNPSLSAIFLQSIGDIVLWPNPGFLLVGALRRRLGSNLTSRHFPPSIGVKARCLS